MLSALLLSLAIFGTASAGAQLSGTISAAGESHTLFVNVADDGTLVLLVDGQPIGAPGVPNPEVPTVPSAPELPGEPGIPSVPETPGLPALPTPGAPQAPALPSLPTLP